MGLSASQVRYLSLTARKSDLEQRDQNLCYQRLEIASKSSDAAKAYSEGMSNTTIRISHWETNGNSSTKVWNQLTFENALEQNYRVIGSEGEYLNPSPYKSYNEGDTISAEEYKKLSEAQKANCTDNGDSTYTVKSSFSSVNNDYKGFDIQTLLMSGRAQLVSDDFYQYLCQHGYGSGGFTDDDGKSVSFQEISDKYSAMGNNTVVAWNTDSQSIFKEDLYTEDDYKVQADYDKITAELEEMDKNLQLQQKNIETEHKAVETEMESVQKVIKDDVEKSYKAFNA